MSDVTGVPATLQLPLLPLKNVVLFPHMIVPLYVGRERSINALEDAMTRGKQVFLCTQRRADCEDPKEADLYRVGVLGEVVQMLKLPDSTIKVLIEGSSRAVIERFIQVEPHLRVEVSMLEEDVEASPELEALMRGVVDLFDRYVELDKKVPPEVNLTVRGVEDAGRMADIVASNLGISVTDKQDVLETFQMNARLEKLSSVLQREIEILDMDRSIRQRVRQQIDRRQKEFYLKEQMRVIQEELGGEEAHLSEFDELREKVRGLELAEAIEERLLKDVDRLERMPPGSPEISVLHNYLDLVVSLPWHESSEDITDLRAAEKVLDEDHHGLRKIKERILEFLATDPVLHRTAGRGQDQPRPFDRASAGPQVRARFAGRRRRRGRDPRPPPNLRGLDAGTDHQGPARGGHPQPGVPARRDRQDVVGLPRRPGLGDARGP